MTFQLPYPRQRHALLSSSLGTLRVISCIFAIVFCMNSCSLAMEGSAGKLTVSTGRRLVANDTTVPLVLKVSTAEDLYNIISSADGSRLLVLNLPPGSLVLTSTLQIPISVTLQGAPSTSNGPGSALRCGTANLTSAIVFSGSRLHLLGVEMTDCSCVGLQLVSTGNADVTIESSFFHGFSRVLGSGRVDESLSGVPASIAPSTTALAIHAGSFSGNLTILSSRFYSNTFMKALSQRRRLYNSRGVTEGHASAARMQQRAVARPSAEVFSADRRRRVMLTAPPQHSSMWADEMMPWGLMPSSRSFSSSRHRDRRLQENGTLSPTSTELQYSMPLLEEAKLLHPGLQAGPWADDLETVLTVVCQKGSECRVTIRDSTFDNNTGVATGAVYVLCDGATTCDVELTNIVMTNNKLLWQQALQSYLSEQSDDQSDDQSDNQPTNEFGTDISCSQSVLSDADELVYMAPWLTYTYPLLDLYKTTESPQLQDLNLMDVTFPNVTGRTLGAVVLHQRNSPSPGVLPSASRPMMLVRVTGGRFSGNDGVALMSTATDFMELASGNGTYTGGPPRHSADFYISGLEVKDHKSSWPAVWLRWPRSVDIKNCTVTNSTGAIWLDEVRDTALLKDSTFMGNTLTNCILDYLSFSSVTDFGWETSHIVKIQMTPLGAVPNFATVSGCTFQGNAASDTGALYIRASDAPFTDVEDLPGRTVVVIEDSIFSANTCGGLLTEDCTNAARPVRICAVSDLTLDRSRFLGNHNGALHLSSVEAAAVRDCEFHGNRLTYSPDEGADRDNSYGGAGVYAEGIGKGGMHIDRSNFTYNTAEIGGGAVYLRFFAFLVVDFSRFDNNVAEKFDGGAIWLEISTSPKETQIADSNFTSNTAGRNGGAISARSLGSSEASSIAWYISRSRFYSNEALLNPLARGPTIVDQSGGGAVFAFGAGLQCDKSTWDQNLVRGHAGGAMRVVDSKVVNLNNCNFTSNAAIMGGAVALSRLSLQSEIKACRFTNNTVVDSRGWEVSPSEGAPSLAYIDPGFGGAVYAFYTTLLFTTSGLFAGNSAKFGGAISMMSSPHLVIQAEWPTYLTYMAPIYKVQVARDVAAAVGLQQPEGDSVLPYRFLFTNNTALIGGGMYIFDTERTDFSLSLLNYLLDKNGRPFRVNNQIAETSDSITYKSHPAIVFLGNTANGGGAMYLEGNGKVSLGNSRFASNKAVVPPLAANYSGLYGREKDYAVAKALPCYNGGGGGICIVGQASTILTIKDSDMIHNNAKDGGGVFLAEGLDCISQQGCYSVSLDQVNMTGNTAAGRGGGVFWTHEGVLNVSKCPSDKTHTLAGGTVTSTVFNNASNDTQPVAQSASFMVSVIMPVRKGPTSNYNQLTVSSQDALLAPVGGAVRVGKGQVTAANGTMVVQGDVVFARTADTGSTMHVADQGEVAVKGAFLTPSGSLVLHNEVATGSGEVVSPPPDWISVASLPVVLGESVLLDPAWYGVPYTHLPCANWDNVADTGPDISSTPYFVLSPRRQDFYQSNTDININVTVHDWLGYNCTGGNDTQPLVLVQADSTEVSGGVTAPAENGTAVFTALRLRAQEGLHLVNMTGRSHDPSRDLLASQLAIYVRPCALNEFLSPKNLDECIPCDTGSYNFNASAVVCRDCPDNADCQYPDPTACKLGSDCSTVGFLVPQTGYWHSNFFSEEVIECTNQDACTFHNRSTELSMIQFAIWQAARNIQLDAASRVAGLAAKEALSQLVAAQLPHRLLQEKAISDDTEVLLILNATAFLLPRYLQKQCAEGYMGTLCGECEPGYGWRRIATCSKCPPRALNNFYYALVTLLTLSLLAFTVFSSLKEQRRPGLLVGGMTKVKDKTKPDAGSTTVGSKPSRSSGAGNHHHHGLGVQASGPSQFHVIIAAAAAEDAAAEAAPTLALLREQRSLSPLADHDFSGPYEYVDPVLMAARNQYGSAPGTPVGNRSIVSQAPFPLFDTAARAHSALGAPLRASWWSNLDDPRRGVVGSFGREIGAMHVTAAAPTPSVHCVTSAGPVAEGVMSGHENALYDAGVGVVSRGEIHAVVVNDVISGGVINRMTEAHEVDEFTPRQSNESFGPQRIINGEGRGQQAVAESKDYNNILYEEPPSHIGGSGAAAIPTAVPVVEIHSTDAPRFIQSPIFDTTTIVNTGVNISGNVHQTYTYDIPGGSEAGTGAGDSLYHNHPQMPPGLVLQSVPVLQSNSPPGTPMHGSITAASPTGLELQTTVTERTRLGELPRRGAVVGRERAHQSTVVKIFVSYIQVLALLQNVPLDIPGVVDVYYRINNQAISYPGILVSLDCSLPYTGVSKAIIRVILTVLAPLYIFVGAVLFFLAYNFVDYYILAPYFAKHPSKKNRKRHLQLPSFRTHLAVYLGRQLIVTFIAIFFFFYPSVVQSLMAIFNCQDVNVQATTNPLANGLGLQTERIWSQDYGRDCYKRAHLALTLGLGMPGVLLIAIGWPLVSALFMTGKLTFMNNIRFTEDMTSFFLADFKAKFAWWESVIMLRKLFIAVIVTLMDGSTYAGVQLLLVISILVISSGIHLVAMPYHHMYTNNLELMSLGTLLATLYFSLYFGFSTSLSDGGRVTISVLILVINIVMVIIFIYYIIQAYFYAALLTAGLGDMDSEVRRKLTAAELQQRILENMTSQGSITNQDELKQQPLGEKQRTSYHRVASLYATAMWYSMRVGSTTNKVLTRVKTLLRDQDDNLGTSHESSNSDIPGESVGVHGTGGAITSSKRNISHGGSAHPIDPEAAHSSSDIDLKRAVSGPGPVSNVTNLAERTSLPKLVTRERRLNGTDGGSAGGGDGTGSTSTSTSSPGIEAGSRSSSFTTAPRTQGSGIGSLPEVKALPVLPLAAIVTTAVAAPTAEAALTAEAVSSPRAEPNVISRSSSSSSLDNPSLPPYPSDLKVHKQQPPPPLMPVVTPLPAVVAVATSGVQLQTVRSQSRLSHVSGGLSERNQEFLPPPPPVPSFTTHGGGQSL